MITHSPVLTQKLLAEVRELRTRLPDVAGVMVASVDGLLLAQDTITAEPDTFAAMTAAQFGLGQQLIATLKSGRFRDMVTAGTDGYVAIFAAGSSALLTIVAGPELNVGRLHHEARPLAGRINKLIAESVHPSRNQE